MIDSFGFRSCIGTEPVFKKIGKYIVSEKCNCSRVETVLVSAVARQLTKFGFPIKA